jgi:hypothetical protein
MGNTEITEIREFGTGLRYYLELHGVSLASRTHTPSNVDLFELVAVEARPSAPSVLTLQPVALAA